MSLVRMITVILFLSALSQTASAAEIRFSGPTIGDAVNYINAASVDRMITKVREAVNAGDRNVTVVLRSDGGDIAHAMRGYRYLRSVGANTLVKGVCASSCTILFAGGNKRAASSGARFMFHGVTVEKHGKRERSEVAKEAAANWLQAIRSVDTQLASRIQRSNILLSPPQKELWFRANDLRTGYVND